MPRIKTDDRAALNTTINKEVLEDFKRVAQESGIPMSIILETFMKQYAAGEFTIKLQKGTRTIEG